MRRALQFLNLYTIAISLALVTPVCFAGAQDDSPNCARLLTSQELFNNLKSAGYVPLDPSDPKCYPPVDCSDKRAASHPVCAKASPSAPGIGKSVNLALEPGRPPVTMHYRIQPAKNPADPKRTMLYFGGGPYPATPLKRGKAFPDIAVPDDVDLIVFDYPGEGENLDVPVKSPDQGYSAAASARLAEAIIKKEHLGAAGGDYMLFGVSYGTIVSTVTAANLSKEKDVGNGFGLPKALDLDSPITKASSGDGTDEQSRVKQTGDAWNRLPVSQQDQIESRLKNLEKMAGGTSAYVNLFFDTALSNPAGADWLLKQKDQTILACAMGSAKKVMASISPKFGSVARCEFMAKGTKNEMWGGLYIDPLSEESLCSKSTKCGTWDAKDHPIVDSKIPIVIRNGGADKLTPVASNGQYLFNSQCGTSRTLCVDQGVHAISSCSSDSQVATLDSIFNGGAGQFDEIMSSSCSANCVSAVAGENCSQPSPGADTERPSAAQ